MIITPTTLRGILGAALLLTALLTPGARGQDEPWARMDYGPFLSTAVGLGGDVAPVHKGIVLRLRTREGELTDLHAVFDTDLLAWRAAWRGELALRGIVFDGPHGTFPEIDGEPLFIAPALPGGPAPPEAAATDPRDEPWGPIPRTWGRWSGLHLDGDDVILAYAVLGGRHQVLERVWAEPHDGAYAFAREITVATAAATGNRGPTLSGATTRANGTVVVAVAGPGAAPPPRPKPLAISVHDAITRARPRWGAPIVTVGTVDDDLDAGGGDRPIVRAAGTPAETVPVVAARGGALELLRDGVVVERGPIDTTVIVRAPDPPTATPFAPRHEIGWWPSDTGRGDFEINAFTGARDLRLDGVTWRRGVRGRALDFDGTAAAWLDGADIDLGQHDLTVAAWIHTTRDGTVFAVSRPEGNWSPDGATLFLRGGRLSFDVGWVGVIDGGPSIDDGAWHHVAATWRHQGGHVALFVDGERVANGSLPLGRVLPRPFVGRFGFTNDDFPAPSRFSGYLDGPIVLRRAVEHTTIPALAALTGYAIVEATVVRGPDAELELTGAPERRLAQLRLPATDTGATYRVRRRRGPRDAVLAWARAADAEADRPFRVDRLAWPADNRFGSWMRFGAFDFVPPEDTAGASAMISTWSGDVWRVDGLDEDLAAIRWTRVATGLNQPFGVAVNDGATLVLGRDQITRLNDHNGDGEADFLENVFNLGRNSEHFHEPASGLLVEPDGAMLYHKAARHAKLALHLHHGTVIRVAPDGRTSTVVAHGFRAPIGLTQLPDGTLLGSDQEGHWTPANRINLIRPAAGDGPAPFHGNGWAAPRSAGQHVERGGERVHAPWPADTVMTPPLCWLHPSFDRSPSSQVFVDHPAWGPLTGSILGLSYGTGDVYLVLRDDVREEDGTTITQGGVVKLGIQLPTGLLAGRIHPATGDLYVCGLFGWSSDRAEPGGFYRIRPRADAWATTLNVPARLRAVEDGLELTFLHPLDRATATDPERWTATAWNYRRTADYGSKTYDLAGQADARTTWTIGAATLSADGRTVHLHIDGFAPAMQVHVEWAIADVAGRPLTHAAHLTVHAVHE